MSPNSSNKGGASGSRGAKAKNAKPIILKLPSSLLSRFPHEKAISKPSSTKSSLSESSSTPAAAVKESPPAPEVKTEVKPEPLAESTPDNNAANGQAQPEGKKKGPGGPKAGQKRRLAAVTDGPPKPRGKPGPKKRKIEGDEAGRPWTTPAATGPGHKLGPKANQGAINAGLRALDRTGKPTRKWKKAGFYLKSFTGTIWALDSWATPSRKELPNGDGAENATPNSTSENQQVSSNVGSEASNNHVTEVKPDIASSPAIIETQA